MKENTQDKMLVQVDENSIFYKIKKFLKNLFYKKETVKPVCENQEKVDNEQKRNSFLETIKNIEDDNIKLLKLQKQYRAGKIKEEDLTGEQKNLLCNLYDKQIANIKKSNEMRKQRLLDYRKKLQEE